MSKIEVNTVDVQCGSTLTLGSCGKTVALASGASQTGFGRTGTVDWITSIKTNSDSPLTVADGKGYFLNTTSGTITVNLPAGSAGSIVAFKDYAKTWDTNAVTLVPNGSDKIGGIAANSVLETENQSVTLIFTDSTRGWIDIHDSTSNTEGAKFIAATGGTVTTVCTNFKVHTFTSPGTFCVSCAGNSAGSNTVSYMVVAGGGGTDKGNPGSTGGGGGGGFREGLGVNDSYTGSPLRATTGVPVTATGFPVTVGAGGTGGAPPQPTSAATQGSSSIFSTITSAGGGKNAGDGGSGGGGPTVPGPGQSPPQKGTGNTPPVSPPQGNPGGFGLSTCGPGAPYIYRAGGGGGATAVGADASPSAGGAGGAGATTSINGSPNSFSGGGGGAAGKEPSGSDVPAGAGGTGGGGAGGARAAGTAGTANTGGGAGGAGYGPGGTSQSGAAGGSGIVIIRYKFQ
tara:strand:- start:3289 stop:4656 length:1368 start_codon:yes stop_codon:yes gene_type:complete